MIYYLLTPFAAIVLVVFQNTLADVLFSGWLTLELSLALVIYAGFRLDALQGAVFAFIVGFVFDCVSGAPPGLFAIIYLMIFIISFFVSMRFAAEKLLLIAVVGLACSLIESALVLAVYYFILKFENLSDMLFAFVLQALLVSFLSVGVFYVMHRMERFFNGGKREFPRRAAAGRISVQA